MITTLIPLQPGETPAPLNAQFTEAMRSALLAFSGGPLLRWRHGWARVSTVITPISPRTIEALRSRGLIQIGDAFINGRRRRRQQGAALTEKGVWYLRTLLAQHREAA